MKIQNTFKVWSCWRVQAVRKLSDTRPSSEKSYNSLQSGWIFRFHYYKFSAELHPVFSNSFQTVVTSLQLHLRSVPFSTFAVHQGYTCVSFVFKYRDHCTYTKKVVLQPQTQKANKRAIIIQAQITWTGVEKVKMMTSTLNGILYMQSQDWEVLYSSTGSPKGLQE